MTSFFLVDQATASGGTLLSSQPIAPERFPHTSAAFLLTLKVVHSGAEQVMALAWRYILWIVLKRSSRQVFPPPGSEVVLVEDVYPSVRRHPPTGESVFYVSRRFTRRIVRPKKKGSGKSGFSFRRPPGQAKWKPRTVVIRDNRTSTHVSM